MLERMLLSCGFIEATMWTPTKMVPGYLNPISKVFIRSSDVERVKTAADAAYMLSGEPLPTAQLPNG